MNIELEVNADELIAKEEDKLQEQMDKWLHEFSLLAPVIADFNHTLLMAYKDDDTKPLFRADATGNYVTYCTSDDRPKMNKRVVMSFMKSLKHMEHFTFTHKYIEKTGTAARREWKFSIYVQREDGSKGEYLGHIEYTVFLGHSCKIVDTGKVEVIEKPIRKIVCDEGENEDG